MLVHWGDEYVTEPSVRQHEWATKLVAAGADLVLGAHPHVVQPAQMVQAGGRQGYVAYSLGNFVFDQPNQAATSHSVVLRAWLDTEGVGKVAVAPVRIVNGRPEPLPLDDPAAQAQITALGHPTTQTVMPTAPRTSGELLAWRWDGTTYSPVAVPAGTLVPEQPQMLDVDLRGNGEPSQATLDNGLVQVRQGNKVVWRNEEPAWNVAGMTSGDADNDGRHEILLRLWKPDQQGVIRSHPFLMGWRGNYYRIFWGGSAVAAPIQDAAIGPVSGNRNALVVAAGGALPGDTADHIGVWTWQGWNFQEQWRSASGNFKRVALLDLDRDGVMEIVAE